MFLTVSVRGFAFGLQLCFLFMLFNLCIYLISQYIWNPVIKPKKDPGLIVWWMCCLRVGHTKEYTKSLKRKEKEKTFVGKMKNFKPTAIAKQIQSSSVRMLSKSLRRRDSLIRQSLKESID